MPVSAEIGQQFGQGRLAEGAYLWAELGGHRVTVAIMEEAEADDAAAGPGSREAPSPAGGIEVRLIPEQHLSAGRGGGVDPSAQELSGLGMVRAGRAHPPPIREHLPGLRVIEREATKCLAREDSSNTPRIEPDL